MDLMNSFLPLKKYKFIKLQFFFFLYAILILYLSSINMLFPLLLPFLAIIMALIIVFPKYIWYIFILSFFYQYPLLEKLNIRVVLSDILFPIFLLSYFGNFVVNGVRTTNFKPNKRVITIHTLLFVIAIISMLINLPTYKHYKMWASSIWYLYRFSQILVALFVFSDDNSEINLENVVRIIIWGSVLQFFAALIQMHTLEYTTLFYARSDISGTLAPHHSVLGTFLLIPIFLTTEKFLKCTDTKDKIRFLAMLIVLILTLIFSGSRSSITGLALSLTILILINFKLNIQYLFFILALVLAVFSLLIFSPLGSLISMTVNSAETGGMDISSASRFFIWRNAIIYFFNSNWLQKLLGFGIGTYMYHQNMDYLWLGLNFNSGAHNNFLHVLCETGIIGLVIFIALAILLLHQLWPHPSKSKYNNSLFYATIAMFGSSFTQETFWFQKSFGVLWLFYIFILTIVLRDNKKSLISNWKSS
ncbi:MAG: hypothetical protein GF398_09260 [Chitinivibrionales bacterium]|nr:hypothetical protein [Chitinivibrionales bacterium]